MEAEITLPDSNPRDFLAEIENSTRIDADFVDCLDRMEKWFRILEPTVPAPEKVPYLGQYVFRYRERTLEQALILKLARVVSGLHGARLLVNNGFVQEAAALQRLLDEFQEDINFLSLARLDDDYTELHQNYLNAFYEEEFDNPADPVASVQKRSMIPRRKIHAYIARKEAEVGVRERIRGAQLRRTLSKLYSGFVHGAAPQILDMYGGWPPRFRVSGMRGTPREYRQREDLWNYFYRGVICFYEVALVLDRFNVADEAKQFNQGLQKAAGKDYSKQR